MLIRDFKVDGVPFTLLLKVLLNLHLYDLDLTFSICTGFLVSTSQLASFALNLLNKEHFNLMHFTFDIGKTAISSGFLAARVRLFLILNFSNLLRGDDYVIVLSLVLFWVLKDGFLLLVFDELLDWDRVTFYLHVVDLAFADDKESFHHAVQ